MSTGQERMLPLTVEYARPLSPDDQGGYRINGKGVEQLAFVWLQNRYVMPGDARGAASGEQFGSDDAEYFAKLFAAAPDLLEALRQVSISAGHEDAKEIARRALAKVQS